MLLEVKNISSGYGNIKALWGISLNIESGEVVSVIGSNGAGKTTLLRTISGLLPTQNGNITFQNQEISSWSPHKISKAGIAHVHEGRRLFGPLTVYENLLCGYYSGSRFQEKGNKEKLFNFTFELFPILKERRNQRAETLSGGEGQMLAIARGLMATPKLLLIDEPSLGLAPLLIESITQTLKNISGRGQSILLVEQNCQVALNVASRVYVLEKGHIAIEGPTEKISADPRIKQIYLG